GGTGPEEGVAARAPADAAGGGPAGDYGAWPQRPARPQGERHHRLGGGAAAVAAPEARALPQGHFAGVGPARLRGEPAAGGGAGGVVPADQRGGPDAGRRLGASG